MQAGADPFTEERTKKRERVKQNKALQLKNLAAGAKGGSAAAGIPASVQLAAKLPEHGRGRPTKRKEMEKTVRIKLSQRCHCRLLVLPPHSAHGRDACRAFLLNRV